MKNKGFTLIELLAVIVILAIIALIITPVISNVIKNASNQANMRSIEGHIANINNNLAANILNNKYISDGIYTFNELELSNYPASDYVRCSLYTVSKNRITQAKDCLVKEKNYCYNNNRASACDGTINIVDNMVSERVNIIRKTRNTDITGRTGSIYYVSTEGDNSNDGLTPETAWQTVSRVREAFTNKEITDGSTVLFRRGDTFSGNFGVSANDILIGSYGNENLPKPILQASVFDGSYNGAWEEVDENIYKYSMGGSDQIFKNDVGGIFIYCKDGDSTCDQSISTVKEKFAMAKKITTSPSTTETEDMLKTVLTHDLEFYHMGHHTSGSASTDKAGAIYLYSTSNPKSRFKEIRFSPGITGITTATYANIVIDNLHFKYFGKDAIAASSTSNLTITNCEFSFIGGMVSSYGANGVAARVGNGINLNGAVKSKANFPLNKGLYINNNYFYEIFNFDIIFYNQSSSSSIMDRVEITNNVIEYTTSNIKYYNYTKSSNETNIANTYINQVYINNNILRYAGMGFSEFKNDSGAVGLIKNGDPKEYNYNYIKPEGEIIIENNILDTSNSGTVMVDIAAYQTLPIFRNNKIYNYNDRPFGYFYLSGDSKTSISLSDISNNSNLSSNEVTIYE